MEHARQTFYRYFPISGRDRKWGLFVTTAGESRITANMPYPPSGHPTGYDFDWKKGRVLDEFALVYISKGQGTYESKGGFRQQVEPGHVMMVFPNVWHRYAPDKKTGWDEHWIGFDGETPRLWVKNGFFTPDHPVLKSSGEDLLLRLFTEIVQTIHSNPPAMQQILSGMTVHTLGLLYSAQQTRAAAGTQAQTAIEKAIVRMQTSLGSTLDVQALAAELGVSYSWLRNNFTAHTGLSPHRYLLELRLVRARNLLTETDASVKQIAVQTGFEDEHYFSRMFHKKVGFPPSEWRARSRPSK